MLIKSDAKYHLCHLIFSRIALIYFICGNHWDRAYVSKQHILLQEVESRRIAFWTCAHMTGPQARKAFMKEHAICFCTKENYECMFFWITPWIKVLLEKLTVAQLVNEFSASDDAPFFSCPVTYQTLSSLPYSQTPLNGRDHVSHTCK